MLSNHRQTDPIVEILRLAYLRGLVLLQEQATEMADAVSVDQIEKPIVSEVPQFNKDVADKKPDTRVGGVP